MHPSVSAVGEGFCADSLVSEPVRGLIETLATLASRTLSCDFPQVGTNSGIATVLILFFSPNLIEENLTNAIIVFNVYDVIIWCRYTLWKDD